MARWTPSSAAWTRRPQNFFGLSHAQLVGGGEALVQGHGDVGQALFPAAAGLGHLRELLYRLESDAADLFSLGKKPASTTPWAPQGPPSDIKARAAVHEGLEGARRRTPRPESRRDEIGAALALRAEEARLKRLHDALPLVARRADYRARFGELAGAVLLPDFSERRQRCQTEAAHAQASHGAARKALEELDRELAGIAVDAVLLAPGAHRGTERTPRAGPEGAGRRGARAGAALARLEAEAARELQQLRPH